MSHLSEKHPAIQFLIEAHRAAVQADETMFDDAGKCIDVAGAAATEQSEKQAFIALVSAQCATADDVQAKVDYFVNGTIGERSDLITYLTAHGDGDDQLLRRLLASLVIRP